MTISGIIVVASAWISSYLYLISSFIPSPFGVGLDIFAGTIIGGVLSGILGYTSYGFDRLAMVGLTGAVAALIGGVVLQGFGFQPAVAGSLVGALAVWWALDNFSSFSFLSK